MGILDLFINKKEYNVSLFAVSKRLKISERVIISVLEEAGFDSSGGSLLILNEKHLEILSQNYVDAVKSYYSSALKNFYNLTGAEQIELKSFFSKFIKYDNIWDIYSPDYEKNIFNNKLDSSLIKEFFYKIIEEIQLFPIIDDFDLINVEFSNVDVTQNKFNKILYKIKLKTKSTFNNTKSRLFTIIITCHYYIFSDDDDHTARAKFIQCFSAVRNLSREALNYINYLKFHIRWKEFSYS